MSDLLPRLTAALSGRSRLDGTLGAGGMATGYRAEGLRHHRRRRRVAIEVLHPELSAVIGPERFLKEIETTASLQHPHILPLFDSSEAAGQRFYVTPLVDGRRWAHATARCTGSPRARGTSPTSSPTSPGWPTAC
jgi:serine/threonine-protein kinase